MAKTTMLDLLNDNAHAKIEQLENVEGITQQIKKQASKDLAHTPVPSPEETKRISVDCPISIYIAANTLRILQKKSLKDYILTLMEQDIQRAKMENTL